MKYRVQFGPELEPEPLPLPVEEKVDKKPEVPFGPLQRNALPDVYPEQNTPRG